MILAIDPGKNKCGLAIVDKNRTVINKRIVATKKFKDVIEVITKNYNLDKVVLGNGTKSDKIKRIINSVGLEVIIIDESNSTLEAREKYWQENPPTGWRRLLPTSLQLPKQPVDDYVAIILANKYLEQCSLD